MRSVCDLVFVSANPPGVYTEWGPNEQAAKESCQYSSHKRLLGRVDCPIECARVVCDVQHDWIRVVSELLLTHHVASCSVINDHCEELECVDRDVRLLLVEERSKLDRFWKLQVPPESQRNQVASAGFKGAVAKHSCEWHPWNQEG